MPNISGQVNSPCRKNVSGVLLSMSNVVDFKPVNELQITVSLDEIQELTLEDLFDIVYDRYEIYGLTMMWYNSDGSPVLASEDRQNSVELIEEIFDEV